MSLRLPAFFLFCGLLLPLHLGAADKNEIEIIIRRGQEFQNKAFQAGPREKNRYLRKAIEEYEKIHYLAPDQDSAYIFAGTCYEHLGEFQKAVEVYMLGGHRVSSRKKKLLLLLNAAKVNTNIKNLKGVGDIISQMEYLDPKAVEIAIASRDMAMDSPDERTRTLYAEKCIRICDYHIKNNRNAEIRELALNLRLGLEGYVKAATQEDVQSRQPDPWAGILSSARGKEYEKVIISHQRMLTAASRLDPLSKGYANPVPAYLPHLQALLESYSAAGNWYGLLEIARHALLRRGEMQDESFQRQPVSAILPALTNSLKSYLATPRPFTFGRPARASLISRLWLYEIKGDALFAKSVNAKNQVFPDADVLALGSAGKGGRPYRILLRFTLPPALYGVRIQKAVVSLLREHNNIRPGSHEDGLPVLCITESGERRQLKDAPFTCPQAKQVLPDADNLMRRDIGKTFGGYSIAQLCSFDITSSITAGRNKSNHAVTIMLSDETVPAFRGFHSPKVSIVVESDESPETDSVEYEEDWLDLYARGLTYVQKEKIGAATVLWEEAATRSYGDPAGRYIREHLAVIREAKR